MGLKYNRFFDDGKYERVGNKVICCRQCLTHLCHSNIVISDGFLGESGQAYLVLDLINYEFYLHLQETQMKTGLYQIHKVRCHTCQQKLGWFYKKAYIPEEEYKEGKFVIEDAYLHFCDNPSVTEALVARAVKNQTSRKALFSSTALLSSSALDALLVSPPRCPYFRRDQTLMGYGYHGMNYANMVRWRQSHGHQKKATEATYADNNEDVFVDD